MTLDAAPSTGSGGASAGVRTMDRRAFLGGLGALGAALAGFWPASAGAAPAGDPEGRRIVAALTAALLPADRAQGAAEQYGAVLAEMDAPARAQLLAGLMEVHGSMTPAAADATPAQVRSALHGWLPRSRIAPPVTAGDPAAIRAAARRHVAVPKPDDPASWTRVEPVPFGGDPAYGKTLGLDDEQRRTARRVSLAVTLVNTLDGRAMAAAGVEPHSKHDSCSEALHG